MEAKSQRPKDRKSAISLLNAAIEAVNLAKEISSITPAKAVFGTVSVLLTMVKDDMANELEYVEIGLECADICRALDRGMDGKKLDDLNQSVCDAINQLTTTMAEIQRKAIKQSKRSAASRFFHAKNDKETITSWKSDLNRILHVFNTELAINTHHNVINTRNMVSEMHRNMLKGQDGADDQCRSAQASASGELPPQPPRGFFGRNDLVEEIVTLVENLTPIAIIGAGGIGKTSIALTVLHNDHIKQRFGDNRRFIRCDQFPPSSNHFLTRLSKVIGASVENPEDLTPLQPFLSSKEMLIVIDNAESVLDLQEEGNQKIYTLVEELSQFRNICLFITSRISTIPPGCETLDIPTLSMEAAQKTFYHIYKHSGQSDLANHILEQLDFHPLSVALLATVSQHNRWSPSRLAKEWEKQRTEMLHVQHNKSLAATIELSLASPMFQELGPDAHALLGVVAFFPQGIDENNLDWLFPTISNRTNIFDKFCILSLTYQSNGFITMLAPLRDYLCPKDPMSAPLLCIARDCYFSRLSVEVDPNLPGFQAAQWITSEDVNVEHLLNVFTTIDAASGDVWDACIHFMEHLYRYKPRLVMLGPKVEGLLDSHPSKPKCLVELSRLFYSVGNYVERKRLLIYTLELQKRQGNKSEVVEILGYLSQTSGSLKLYAEGIQQAKEALEIYRQLNHKIQQAQCLKTLAYLLHAEKELDAAEEAALQSINLLSDTDDQYTVCKSYRVLGNIYHSKGDREKAVKHYETALGIASPFKWHDQLFWNHYALAELFCDGGRFNDAHIHIEHAKSHSTNRMYRLGCVMLLQANNFFQQVRLEEAKSEALSAFGVFEELGASKKAEACRRFLKRIEKKMNAQGAEGSGN